MPNHIQNRLTIKGEKEQVAKVLAAISTIDEEGEAIPMDFNKIIPMPKELQIESGSLGENTHYLLFGGKAKFFPIPTEELQRRFTALSFEDRKKAVEIALQYQSNKEKYGHTTWYDWSREHWGTKWNAYGQPDKRNTENTIFFQTAWAAPLNLMKRLSGLFPKVTFEFMFADEDSGSNIGELELKDGKTIAENLPQDRSFDAFEIYFELHPESREYYKLVDGNYQYVEEAR